MEPKYLIFGWREDGGPLFRQGHSWLKYAQLGVADQKAIKGLTVGGSVEATFGTLAGPMVYRVERSA